MNGAIRGLVFLMGDETSFARIRMKQKGGGNMWVFGFVACLVIGLGYAVDRLRLYDLLSGYNTMSDEEKARIDVKRVARLTAILCYGMGALFFILAANEGFAWGLPLEPLFIALFVWTVIMLWRMQRYDGNIYDASGRLRPGGKKRLIPIILVSLFLLVGVPGLFLYFNQPTDVTVTETTLVIDGSYGEEIPITSIEDVTLTTLPPIGRKISGAATDSRLVGDFRTEEGMKVRLYIDRDVSPVIRIDTSERRIYLNQETEDATTTLFEELTR